MCFSPSFLAGRKVFRDFLKCEYSEENIMFWQACEDLRKCTDSDTIEEKARSIYDDFISILSPREVREFKVVLICSFLECLVF